MPDDADGTPEVPVICTECDTTARIPLSGVADRLERHNERLHDGEDVARVDPDVAEQVADMAATDLGLFDE